MTWQSTSLQQSIFMQGSTARIRLDTERLFARGRAAYVVGVEHRFVACPLQEVDGQLV